jgi:hypothetical protein
MLFDSIVDPTVIDPSALLDTTTGTAPEATLSYTGCSVDFEFYPPPAITDSFLTTTEVYGVPAGSVLACQAAFNLLSCTLTAGVPNSVDVVFDRPLPPDALGCPVLFVSHVDDAGEHDWTSGTGVALSPTSFRLPLLPVDPTNPGPNVAAGDSWLSEQLPAWLTPFVGGLL